MPAEVSGYPPVAIMSSVKISIVSSSIITSTIQYICLNTMTKIPYLKAKINRFIKLPINQIIHRIKLPQSSDDGLLTGRNPLIASSNEFLTESFLCLLISKMLIHTAIAWKSPARRRVPVQYGPGDHGILIAHRAKNSSLLLLIMRAGPGRSSSHHLIPGLLFSFPVPIPEG